jgi:hypothetical protein
MWRNQLAMKGLRFPAMWTVIGAESDLFTYRAHYIGDRGEDGLRVGQVNFVSGSRNYRVRESRRVQ